MAYRRRRSYRYRIPRRVYRNTFYRAARSTQRQFAAANAQRDIARFTLKYSYSSLLQMQVSSGKTQAGAVLDLGIILKQNPQWYAFSNMFDEAKINGIRLKLTPAFQVASPDVFSPSIRPTVVWAWDRNGVTENDDFTGAQAFQNIACYGSARSTSLSPGTSGVIVSSIYATDIMERGTYWGTKQLMTYSDEAGLAHKAFMPDFCIAVKLPGNATATTTFSYTVEAAFDMTFRGVRYAGASV